MSKMTLSFSLPEETAEMNAALKGREALSALHDIERVCREKLKYGDSPAVVQDFAQAIRDLIPQELLDL